MKEKNALPWQEHQAKVIAIAIVSLAQIQEDLLKAQGPDLEKMDWRKIARRTKRISKTTLELFKLIPAQ
jgi:hypothetical protein